MNETDNRARLIEIEGDSWELVEEEEGRLYVLIHPDEQSEEEHRQARKEEHGMRVVCSSDDIKPFHQHIGRFCICEVEVNNSVFRYQGRLTGIEGERLHFESRDGSRKTIRQDAIVDMTSEEYKP